jgi:uncharacterized membrane protein HdeD (DUF308 family)
MQEIFSEIITKFTVKFETSNPVDFTKSKCYITDHQDIYPTANVTHKKEGCFMNKTTSRILWLISGILLLIAGIISLIDPGVAVITVSTLLGIFMLVYGIVDIVIYAKGKNLIAGSSWLLVNGILTLIFAVFILFDQLFAALSLSFIVGMWLLISGIGKTSASLELKKSGVAGWGWFMATGIILTAAGFISFISPVSQLIAISALVGVLLLMQGISLIIRACLANNLLE